jgi:hypothetical protein
MREPVEGKRRRPLFGSPPIEAEQPPLEPQDVDFLKEPIELAPWRRRRW